MKIEKGSLDMKKTVTNSGNFIAFEGIDGSGKSTQIKLLMKRLKSMGVNCYETKEPTDSPIGSLIHQIMTGRILTDNKVVAALFVADRLDHLLNKVDGIEQKIKNGVSVISDRYYFSSYAYHSVDMPMDWVIEANSQSALILRPTVTIFIDVDPDIALERIKTDRCRSELFETRDRLVRVRQNYLASFEKLAFDEKVIIINGNRSEDEIEIDIWNQLEEYFK